jgi:hypothetical protein
MALEGGRKICDLLLAGLDDALCNDMNVHTTFPSGEKENLHSPPRKSVGDKQAYKLCSSIASLSALGRSQ